MKKTSGNRIIGKNTGPRAGSRNIPAVKKNQQKKTRNSTSAGFPVVGIGASAGGLEALEQFFGKVPDNTGMAFVVVQHLDPNREDILPELLSRMTKMKVVRALDAMKVRPDTVYVIPPRVNLSMMKGSLYLFEPTEKAGLRLPIDFFFRSLSEDLQDNAVGVVLSGMGSDGTLGLRAIKEHDADIISPMHEDFAIGALQCRTGDDGALSGRREAVDLVGDRL